MPQEVHLFTQVLSYDHYQGNVSSLLNTKISVSQTAPNVFSQGTLWFPVASGKEDHYGHTTNFPYFTSRNNDGLWYSVYGNSNSAMGSTRYRFGITTAGITNSLYKSGSSKVRPQSRSVLWYIKY